MTLQIWCISVNTLRPTVIKHGGSEHYWHLAKSNKNDPYNRKRQLDVFGNIMRKKRLENLTYESHVERKMEN